MNIISESFYWKPPPTQPPPTLKEKTKDNSVKKNRTWLNQHGPCTHNWPRGKVEERGRKKDTQWRQHGGEGGKVKWEREPWSKERN